jgi:hypothetical protein
MTAAKQRASPRDAGVRDEQLKSTFLLLRPLSVCGKTTSELRFG